MSFVTPVDLAVAAVALLLGYVIGSLPISALVGRAVGIDAEGGRDPGVATVWRLAGPGWGLLALVADLALGVLPVSLAAVTFSWAAGWAAGLGALAGAGWPAPGRLRRGRGATEAVVLAGVLAALQPPAAVASGLLALAVLLVARLGGRDGRAVAAWVGLAAYPVAFLLVEQDLERFTAVVALYVVAWLRASPCRR